jgi:hypothetical protein
MLRFSYFAKNFYPFQKPVFKFHPFFFGLEKGGRQRKGERELGREGFGEKEFNKKECLLLI